MKMNCLEAQYTLLIHYNNVVIIVRVVHVDECSTDGHRMEVISKGDELRTVLRPVYVVLRIHRDPESECVKFHYLLKTIGILHPSL